MFEARTQSGHNNQHPSFDHGFTLTGCFMIQDRCVRITPAGAVKTDLNAPTILSQAPGNIVKDGFYSHGQRCDCGVIIFV